MTPQQGVPVLLAVVTIVPVHFHLDVSIVEIGLAEHVADESILRVKTSVIECELGCELVLP